MRCISESTISFLTFRPKFKPNFLLTHAIQHQTNFTTSEKNYQSINVSVLNVITTSILVLFYIVI